MKFFSDCVVPIRKINKQLVNIDTRVVIISFSKSPEHNDALNENTDVSPVKVEIAIVGIITLLIN